MELSLSIIAILISFLTLAFTYFKVVNEVTQRLTRVETKLESVEKKLGNNLLERVALIENKLNLFCEALITTVREFDPDGNDGELLRFWEKVLDKMKSYD